jgi:hypothetical protein
VLLPCARDGSVSSSTLPAAWLMPPDQAELTSQPSIDPHGHSVHRTLQKHKAPVLGHGDHLTPSGRLIWVNPSEFTAATAGSLHLDGGHEYHSGFVWSDRRLRGAGRDLVPSAVCCS